MLPLSHPKSAFHVSENCQTVSQPVAPGDLCLSLPGSHGGLSLPRSYGAGMSQEPLSDSPFDYILRKWKIWTLQKAWPRYKLGDPKNGL